MSLNRFSVAWGMGVSFLCLLSTVALAGTAFELTSKDFKPDSPTRGGGFGAFPGMPQPPKPTTPVEPKESTITVLAQGHQISFTTLEKAGQVKTTMLFNGQKKEVVIVDHQDKSFSVLDAATLASLKAKMESFKSQSPFQMPAGFNMEEMLKHVPADKRAEIEAQMKQHMPNQMSTPPADEKSELKKTGEKKTINGLPAVKFDVLKGGKKTREAWVVDWDKVEGGKEVMGVFNEMSAFVNEMLASFSQGTGMKGGPQGGGDLFAHIEEIGGFPVVTRVFGDDGSLEEETTLDSARRRTLDPADFEPPAGYQRRSMMGGL